MVLRPHITHDLSWLGHVVDYRGARSGDICWRPQHEHAMVGKIKPPISAKTLATIEMHQFFSEIPQSGGLRSIPTTDLELNETGTGLKIPWSRNTTKTTPSKEAICDGLGLRSPVIQKYFRRKVLACAATYTHT